MNTNRSMLLQVEGISCQYETRGAVLDASFSLEQGMVACLLGPSGCGKTTILRAIAGFQKLMAGSIHLNGRCIADARGHLPPEQRNLSMVFQEHALFPHINVEKNVAAGLHGNTSGNAKEKKKIVQSMLERVGLSGMGQRYPHQLSGGQQQRVALARALAPNPRLLLMDEPFSNLDLDLREKLRQEVRALLKDTDTTCLLVTHDQQDAFTFGEQIGVMNRGTIEQWDTAYRLYHQPATRFVADFIGEGVFLDGVVSANHEIETELANLHGLNQPRYPVGAAVKVLIRPDDIIHDDDSSRSAKIKKREFRGENYMYTLELPSGKQILSVVPSHHDHQVGENLGIVLDIHHLVVFPT